MESIIKIFKALSDETRLKILMLISKRSMCSKGLANHLSITEAAISQHIKVLKESNLIIGYKVGYHNFYELNHNGFEMIQGFFNDFENTKFIEENFRLSCLNNCKHKKCSINLSLKEDKRMKVCFPVKTNKGLDSIPYGHFGTAPEFIICDIETGEVRSINNGDLGHEHGKCQPMKALSGEVVDAIIVGGIGQGAITRLNSMGIKVYKAEEGTVNENINKYKKNELLEFNSNHTCNHDGCNH